MASDMAAAAARAAADKQGQDTVVLEVGQVLAITFTNKAAGEMRERVAGLVGPAAETMWVSTFHSACVRILRREATKVGLRSSFSIYDAADSQRLMALVCRELDLDPSTACTVLGFTLRPAASPGADGHERERLARLVTLLTDAFRPSAGTTVVGGTTYALVPARRAGSVAAGTERRSLLRLAEQVPGTALYMLHVSAANGVQAIREARARNLPVYGESLHQYMLYTQEDYKRTGMGMDTRTAPGRAGWRRSGRRTSGGCSSRWC